MRAELNGKVFPLLFYVFPNIASLSEIVSRNNFKVIKSLIEEEGSWPQKNEDRRKIIDLAAQNCGFETILYILRTERSPLSKRDGEANLSELQYIARIAAKKDRLDILKDVVRKDPDVLLSPVEDDFDASDKDSTGRGESSSASDASEYDPESEDTSILTRKEEKESIGHIAAKNGYLEIIRYIRKKEPSTIMEKDAHEKNIALVAAENGHWNIVWYIASTRRLLLTQVDDEDNNILHLAIRKNTLNLKTLERLYVDEGIRLLETNKKGYTIAHTAAECGNLHILRYVVERRPKVLDMITSRGSKSIAHVAAYAGQWNILWYVLRKNPSLFALKDSRGYTPLHLVVEKNGIDPKAFKILVEKKKIVLTDTNCRGCTMAHTAAEKGNIDIVRYIAEKEPSVLAQKSEDGTVAAMAAKNDHWNIVLYLAEKNPSVFAEEIFHGETILHLAIAKNAIDKEKLKILVEEEGVPMTGKNWLKETIAHYAAKSMNNTEGILEYICEKEPSLLEKHSAEDTIAHTAAKRGRLRDMIPFLVKKTPLIFAQEDRNGDTVLHKAILENLVDLKTLKFLVEEKGFPLNKTDGNGDTIAHIAAGNGNKEIVEYVVEKNRSTLVTKNENGTAKPSIFDEKNSDGETITFLAAGRGQKDVINFIAKEHPSALLEKVHDPDTNGTVLNLAIENNALDVETLKFLVEEKAFPLVETNSPEENVACSAAKAGNLDIIKFIATKDPAALAAKDSNGDSVARLAARYHNFDILRYVIEKCPALLARNFYSSLFERQTDEDLSSVIKYLARKCKKETQICQYADFKTITIHGAVRSGQRNVVKYLIKEERVDVNVKNKRGQPLLFTALRSRHVDIFKYLVEEENADLTALNADENNILYETIVLKDLPTMMYVLDERKTSIDVNWRNKVGDTVLHVAVRRALSREDFHLIVYLVERKYADVNAKNLKGRTPICYANSDIYNYLIRHGANPPPEDEAGKNRSRRSVLPYLKQGRETFPALDEYAEHAITGDGTNYLYSRTRKTNSSAKSQLSNFLMVVALLFKDVNGSRQQEIFQSSVELSNGAHTMR